MLDIDRVVREMRVDELERAQKTYVDSMFLGYPHEKALGIVYRAGVLAGMIREKEKREQSNELILDDKKGGNNNE